MLTDPGTALPIADILRAAGLRVAAATVPAPTGDPYREAISAVDRAPLVISAWATPAVDRATSALVAARLADRISAGPSPVWVRISRDPVHPAPPFSVHIPLSPAGTLGPEARGALARLAAGDLGPCLPAAAGAAGHLLAALRPPPGGRERASSFDSTRPAASGPVVNSS
ncbi:hypothetical protein RVR_9485 [Actinacidiphila reveromycinica]|uniref:Uncharacterized protein n=1 Tax=Actinacidiphila reveromycinica TaxID=659352 RepID=A0A7U3V007_9ACTN|nr:hypothetical protein RVR_9485 [Streptomyces sp. SN-593]